MWSHISILLFTYICLLQNIALANESTNLAEDSSVCTEKGVLDVNTLGFKLLNRSVTQPGNIFLSPVGAAFSLGILYLVAANETAQQIEKILVRREDSKLHPAKVQEELSRLLQTLKGTENNFSTSNEVLLQDCRDVKDEFARVLQKNYRAEIRFVNDSQPVEMDIDAENVTENFIDSTTPSGSGQPNIEVVNSMAFNNSWKVQFLPERTQRDYFYSGRRETTEVWMMSIEAETFKYYENHEMKYKFIELPYENGHMSMILALPTQYDQPASLQLDTKTFCDIKSKLIPTKLDMVSIPKLQFEDERSIKEQLIAMGLNAFNESTADLPGISEDENIYVSDVKQKINIEVDEDGSEAASITKLNFKPVAFRGVKEFIANHPFLFYVEDRKTGAILLSGRVDEPSESISFSEHLHF